MVSLYFYNPNGTFFLNGLPPSFQGLHDFVLIVAF